MALRYRTLRSRVVLLPALALAGLAVASAGCDGQVSLGEPSTGAGTGKPGTPGDAGSSRPARRQITEARDRLAELRVAGEGSGSGYRRDRFGVRWKDTDHNGCDQRNDVLARDLVEVSKRGRCIVISGLLHDPYSGKDITFDKSDAAEVQIDHLYPLALAWRMGADEWAEDRRESFANDHDNLLAVWGTPNRQKSDSGPGEWKPQKAFQCTYAMRYVAVALEYRLPVNRADHDALAGFLDRC